MEALLFPLLIVVIGALVLIPLINQNIIRPTRPRTPTTREILDNQPTFPFYNYLLKSVRVEAVTPNGNSIVTTVAPRSRRDALLSIVEKYLVSGTAFRIVLFDEFKKDWPERVFSTYTLNIPEAQTIKELHIGMMVSKWVGASNDYSVGRNGGTAVQGVPWLRMHNLTDYPLEINENINITAGGVLRYTGRQFFGVALGTRFVDQDGIFPEFVMNIPATDLYIGVTSDLKQGKFGGFQLTPEFYDDENVPNDMQHLDNLTGPPISHIVPGFLPIEGPSVKPVNRWGENI